MVDEASDLSRVIGTIRGHHGRFLALMLLVALGGCAPAGDGTDSTTAPPASLDDQTHEAQDIWKIPALAPLEPGEYFIDPDFDPSTPLLVFYEIPSSGWSQWIGGFKRAANGHVGVSITEITNLVTDGCHDHSHADPPIGPSVDDLATALTNLAPFEVTSPPANVNAYGHSGQYLALIVPNLPVEGSGANLRFTDCEEGRLKSWVAPFDTEPNDAFYGYTRPAFTEEFWILDVEGTRLMIAAERSADSPHEDLEDLRTILESIRIEP